MLTNADAPGSGPPTTNADGTITAVVAPPPDGGVYFDRVPLRLPRGALQSNAVAGRYFLARCGAQSDAEREQAWSIYLRRPLFVAGSGVPRESEDSPQGATWEFLAPRQASGHAPDPGYAWLRSRPVGQTVNLIGPLGNGFSLNPRSRNLLLIADTSQGPDWLALLMPLVNPALDTGRRVVLLLRQGQPVSPQITRSLPLPVEIHTAASTEEWRQLLRTMVKWADQVCAGISTADMVVLAEEIRSERFRVEDGFAQVLVRTSLVCGTGACLACVISLPTGSITRACVHGPVFDLTRLVS
jgi:dihydroorotate dehydrogenase electron transfer subunit